MRGIDLNQPITFSDASLRYFKENEYHITRHCPYDVLLLVFDGVLRFTEDGIPHEIHPGEYHIQKRNSYQFGGVPSDAPKYLFIHFIAAWDDSDTVLPFQGTFDYTRFKPHLEAMDELWHNGHILSEQLAKFYEILTMLYRKPSKQTVAHEIADYITRECGRPLSLDELAERFHFSKNHIINLFKEAYGMTPITYLLELKLRKAERLLTVTSDSVKSIAFTCGFNDYAYFYKLFLRKHGISPGEWRKQRQI